MLTESVTGTAFLMGIISACSLPLGALTSVFWRPTDRVVAFLMAFGGGALLAALTIDLVGSALARGHFYFLAFGCILGGLLFVILNQIVNDYGGFLRKASTTIYHLRRKEHRRFKRVFSELGRLDIFKDISASEFKALTSYIRSESYKQGNWIFRPGDPSDALYVIADGEIELVIPKHENQTRERLHRNDAFGRLAFLSSAPHANGALVVRDTTVWVLPRVAFVHLLPNSPPLQQAVHRWLRSEELYQYLQESHGLTPEQVQRWTDDAVASLGARGIVPPAVALARRDLEFRSVANQISRLPIFADLPAHELEAIASRILFKRHQRGETFFHPGDHADRLYIIEHGEVSLLDPRRHGEKPTYLHDHDAFGALSFLTGARHSVSAVATEDMTVWVLRRKDFLDLLRQTPALAQHVKAFLSRLEVASYLQRKQQFDHDAAARWTARAIRDIDSGKLIPAVRITKAEIEQHGGGGIGHLAWHYARWRTRISGDRRQPDSCSSEPFTARRLIFVELSRGALKLHRHAPTRLYRESYRADVDFPDGDHWRRCGTGKCVLHRGQGTDLCHYSGSCCWGYADHDSANHAPRGLLQGRLYHRIFHPARFSGGYLL